MPFPVYPLTSVNNTPRLVEHPKTVLLVDDNLVVLQLLSEILCDAGYRVLLCNSGAAAIATFKAIRPIDLLLTDFQMPEMTGLELAYKLSSTAPDLPVLVLSGAAFNEFPSWDRWHKHWDFLAKPTNSELLLTAVKRLCGAAKKGVRE